MQVPQHKLLLLIALCFLSLFPNLNNYQFRGEEALRTIVAYEMDKSGNWAQPTLLGEPYYNKPPLFNWLITGSSKLIPWSELTARSVTLTFLLLTLVLTYLIGREVLGDKRLSLLSSLIFISFSDVLFWYGYLAEIDITLTFFNTLAVLLLLKGFKRNSVLPTALSGAVAGFAFLLKGLPAYAFWVLGALALMLKYNAKMKTLGGLGIAGLLALSVPYMWLINTPEPSVYLEVLFRETINKVGRDSDISRLIFHFIEYPLLTFKQLIPASLLIMILLIKNKELLKDIPHGVKTLLLISALNYLPYLVSIHSKGRYILPIFPLIAVMFSYFLQRKESYLRVFLWIALILAVLRFIFGFFGLPILEKQRGPLKQTAHSIYAIAKNEKLACECSRDERKAVCLYLDFKRGDVVKTRRHIPDWKFLVSCVEINSPTVSEVAKFHIRKDQYVWLYLKLPQDRRR